MGDILLYLQQQDGVVGKPSQCALSAAVALKQRWMKGKIVGITLGPKAKDAAASASLGLDEILYCDAPELEHYLGTTYASTVVGQIVNSSFDTFVAAATSVGKDMAPRVTAALKAGQASDIVAVNEDGSLKRPMYAGDILADVEILTPTKVVTVRPTAFPPLTNGAHAQLREVSFTAPDSPSGTFVEYKGSGGDRPELGDAGVVVSGGRALQSAENFEKYIFPLADALGAAVGASRAAVDSGYAPNDWQVGQTGKVVAPQLYIAVGISGAIQHLAGMKDSKTIVAINKDADAPIFEIADYGLVADLFEALPKLTEEIKRAKGK